MRGNFHSWNPTLTNPIWEQIRARQQGFSKRAGGRSHSPSTSPPAASRGPRRACGSAAGSSARSACGRQPAALLTDAGRSPRLPGARGPQLPVLAARVRRRSVGRRAHADAPGAAGRNRRRRASGILRARGRPIVRRRGADLRPADPRRRPQHPRLRHQLVADGDGTARARMDRPAGDRAARHHLSRSLPVHAPVELPGGQRSEVPRLQARRLRRRHPASRRCASATSRRCGCCSGRRRSFS